MHPETFKGPEFTRTVSPSVHPRFASGDATDFFLASALSDSPTGLATSRWRRRSMRPTDICHPIELRVPAPRAFPARSRHFRSGDAPQSLRLCAVNRGTGCFTTSERPLRRIATNSTLFTTRAPWPHDQFFWSHERGRFLPTALMRSSL
jgi:hypothetical protein